jgi:hypothetical protein
VVQEDKNRAVQEEREERGILHRRNEDGERTGIQFRRILITQLKREEVIYSTSNINQFPSGA